MKKINIKELAAKLKLSVSSVSRGLNNHNNISSKTKQKILKAAKKYNYTPDLSAKRLASKKSDTIAFITTIIPSAHDGVLLEFIAGICLAIKNKQTELLVKFLLDEKNEIKYFEKVALSGAVDKFIFYRTKLKDPRIELLQKHNINFVSWGRSVNSTDYAWIDMDNEKSIKILMERLLNFGHKKIALINVHQSFNYGFQRKKSYEKILKGNNIEINSDYYHESLLGLTSDGMKFTQFMLSLKKPPTAIICSSDKFLIGALQECQNRKLKVGKDISIVGYNDHTNYLSSQNLTYISHPLSKMGEIAVDSLEKIEQGEKVKNLGILIEPILNKGKSDGPNRK